MPAYELDVAIVYFDLDQKTIKFINYYSYQT